MSKDPSTKVGCVAVRPDRKQFLSSGYNGIPRGLKDTEQRLNDRAVKYQYIIHAEQNCIYNACFTGQSLDGADLYVHGLPVCHECAKAVIQVGIKRVVMNYQGSISDKWRDSSELAIEMLSESGVSCMVFHIDDYTSGGAESRNK
jgi:dCMP deaminase